MHQESVVQVFFNPTSGYFSSRRLRALTKALEDEGAKVILTSSVASAPHLDPEATHVCIAGGDGTIRHVASVLTGDRLSLPVAIFPMGTVNLLAREGKSHTSPAVCAHDLLHAKECRPHFPVSIARTMFFACASAGPDSVAVAWHSPKLKRLIGRMAYLVAFALVLWSWPRPRIRIAANGKAFECEAVYIAKGRYFAGPWSFAPTASVSDNLLHVLALTTARRRDFLRFVVTLLLSRDPARMRGAISFTCTDLSAQCEDDVLIQADGDTVAKFPVRLAVRTDPINFR